MHQLIKTVTLIFLICLGFLTPAIAADAALKRVMGFSPDGRYFTFEQYGIQDGSGFPYVDIYFIDTVNNSWVKDIPPIHIVIKKEGVSIDKARALAIHKATPFIKQLGTILHGFTLVSNPITQLDAKKYSAHFGIHPSAPTLNQYNMTLQLASVKSSKCKQFTSQKVKIFTLQLTKAGNVIQTYKDKSLPTSRGCVLDYSISDIYYFEAINGDVVFLTLINLMKFGFEGLDRRFMVIPFYIKK